MARWWLPQEYYFLPFLAQALKRGKAQPASLGVSSCPGAPLPAPWWESGQTGHQGPAIQKALDMDLDASARGFLSVQLPWRTELTTWFFHSYLLNLTKKKHVTQKWKKKRERERKPSFLLIQVSRLGLGFSHSPSQNEDRTSATSAARGVENVARYRRWNNSNNNDRIY